MTEQTISRHFLSNYTSQNHAGMKTNAHLKKSHTQIRKIKNSIPNFECLMVKFTLDWEIALFFFKVILVLAHFCKSLLRCTNKWTFEVSTLRSQIFIYPDWLSIMSQVMRTSLYHFECHPSYLGCMCACVSV